MATVERWQIVRTIRRQNLAEHSYFVACYARKICEVIGITNPAYINHVCYRALFHDIGEIIEGDIPSPFREFLYGPGSGAYIPQDGVTRTGTPEERTRSLSETLCEAVLAPPADLVPQLDSLTIDRIVKIADVLEAVVFLIEESRIGNYEVGNCLNHLGHKLTDAIMGLDPVFSHKVQSWVDEGIKSCYRRPTLVTKEMISGTKSTTGKEDGSGTSDGQS